MKKMISLMVVAFMATVTFAQSAKDLAKQQKELNEINMKMLNAKPSKDAKKQAKEYKKEGWQVPVGEQSMEKQITKAQLYEQELMTNEDGGITQRYLQHTSQATSGSYNSGYAAARAACLTEVAGMIETKLSAAWKNILDNEEESAVKSTTNDKFNQRAMGIVRNSLSNSIPMVVIYRVLPNNQYQISVRLAFDKKEIAARLKRNLKKELEMEGDKLDGMVEDMICKEL